MKKTKFSLLKSILAFILRRSRTPSLRAGMKAALVLRPWGPRALARVGSIIALHSLFLGVAGAQSLPGTEGSTTEQQVRSGLALPADKKDEEIKKKQPKNLLKRKYEMKKLGNGDVDKNFGKVPRRNHKEEIRRNLQPAERIVPNKVTLKKR